MSNENEKAKILRISELTDKPVTTLYGWAKEDNKNKKLFDVLEEYTLLKDNEKNLNETDILKKELIKAIEKLPHSKTKKFYHLIMAELAEMGH